MNREKYAVIWKDGKEQYEHRLIAEDKYGCIPEGFLVHHVDFNQKNNNPDNLILMTVGEHISLHVKERWKNIPDRFEICKKCCENKKYYSVGLCYHCYHQEWYKETRLLAGHTLRPEYKKNKIICMVCNDRMATTKFMCSRCYRKKWRRDKKCQKNL